MGDGRLDDDTCQSRPGHLLRPALQYGMLDLMLRQTAKSSTISLARLLALVSKTPGEDVELEGEDVGCEVNVEEAEEDRGHSGEPHQRRGGDGVHAAVHERHRGVRAVRVPHDDALATDVPGLSTVAVRGGSTAGAQGAVRGPGGSQ